MTIDRLILTPERIQEVMCQSRIKNELALYERLIMEHDFRIDLYGNDQLYFASDINYLSMANMTFSVINWYLFQHTKTAPMLGSKTGLSRNLPLRHAREIAKVLLCIDESDDLKFTDPFLEIGSKCRLSPYEDSRATELMFVFDSDQLRIGINRFAKFCLENKNISIQFCGPHLIGRERRRYL